MEIPLIWTVGVHIISKSSKYTYTYIYYKNIFFFFPLNNGPKSKTTLARDSAQKKKKKYAFNCYRINCGFFDLTRWRGCIEFKTSTFFFNVPSTQLSLFFVLFLYISIIWWIIHWVAIGHICWWRWRNFLFFFKGVYGR